MEQNGKKISAPNTTEGKRSGKTETTGRHRAKETESKALHAAKPGSRTVERDSNVGSGTSEINENLVIHNVEAVNRCEDSVKEGSLVSNENMGEVLGDHSRDTERDQKLGQEEESDSGTIKDSVSSHGGDSVAGDDEKLESLAKAPKTVGGTTSRTGIVMGTQASKSSAQAVTGTPEKLAVCSKRTFGKASSTNASAQKVVAKEANLVLKPPSETAEGGVEDMIIDDGKEENVFEGASNAATRNVASGSGTVEADKNGEHGEETTHRTQRIAEMETKIEKLEVELREVAALEISVYSVVPEHGSSVHKLHTPARRLSRLYTHAVKHWTLDKRATIAKNSVSGLVLISKSCGTDVPRLSFWLSNIIVLREIISQMFQGMKKGEGKFPPLEWKGSSKHGSGEDWRDTGTFIAALEKVESWVFARIVDSVWGQVLTPHMQAPSEELSSNKSNPILGDEQQVELFIKPWKKVFEEAFRRICPVRTREPKCGCLPVIAKMVMEQCMARFDVAMFNAILREPAHEIQPDSVSDPIVDSRLLPIPTGNFSFASGGQLKHSIKNLLSWLTDTVAIDAESQCFNHLTDLSVLLMLPKGDLELMKKKSPSIGLPLLKRILCNFTPNEFCADVPGAVLDELNAELELSGGAPKWSFPYSAAPAVYVPPSRAAALEKVAKACDKNGSSDGGWWVAVDASVVPRKGHTSDEELEDLDSPLNSILGSSQSSSNRDDGMHGEHRVMNARYELLREVWSD